MRQNKKVNRIALVLYEHTVQSSASGIIDLFEAANELIVTSGKQQPFQIELASEKTRNLQLQGGAKFTCHKRLDEVSRVDLVIIPPFQGNVYEVLKKNLGITKWLTHLKKKRVEIASLCKGSYFLGEAGLLHNKEATSHWAVVDDMKKRYPQAKILSDKVITDNQGIYTSGGAFSSFNLILYLIEKFRGRELAIRISKDFSIDLQRPNQSYYSIFTGQRKHRDETIHKAQNYIEQNYSLPLLTDDIAAFVNMSRRNFIRRFKNATNNTPLEYVQRIKIEAAKKSLETGNTDISSIVYDVGYNDLKTFRALFKRTTGLSPQEYYRKYNRAI